MSTYCTRTRPSSNCLSCLVCLMLKRLRGQAAVAPESGPPEHPLTEVATATFAVLEAAMLNAQAPRPGSAPLAKKQPGTWANKESAELAERRGVTLESPSVAPQRLKVQGVGQGAADRRPLAAAWEAEEAPRSKQRDGALSVVRQRAEKAEALAEALLKAHASREAVVAESEKVTAQLREQ